LFRPLGKGPLLRPGRAGRDRDAVRRPQQLRDLWTSANSRWRSSSEPAVACFCISSSMRRSHGVAGTGCAGFQKCVDPELNQKSRVSAGSVALP
jgi:hypothetical protein